MSNNSFTISCNRQPFLSDDSCDRGSVDIHQFDDLPFCQSINPTEPEIPPEIVESPLAIPVPPACACFNIKQKMEFRYSKKRKFKAVASFAANGDCCEGQYNNNFDIEIPCPIIGNGKVRTIKMKIGYGDSGSSKTASYIKTNEASCTIEPKNVDINLQIHCPITKDDGLKTLRMKIGYGDKGNSDVQPFIKANHGSCIIEPKNMKFDLRIPCPVPDQNGPKRLKMKIGYGSSGSYDSQSFVKTDHEKCTIEPKDMDFDLRIPCPVPYQNGPKRLKMKIGYGDSGDYDKQSFVKTDHEKCTIEPKDMDFDLRIPCPIPKASGPKTLKMKIGYGSSGDSDEQTFVGADHEDCIIDPMDMDFNLRIPCPIKKNNDSNKIKIGASWNTTFKSCSASFFKIHSDSCALEMLSPELKLNIRCPIFADRAIPGVAPGELKLLLKYKNDTRAHWASHKQRLLSYNVDNCSLNIRPLSMSFALPCPVAQDYLTVDSYDIRQASNSSSSASFYITEEEQGNNCKRRLKFHIKFPMGGGSENGACQLVRGKRGDQSFYTIINPYVYFGRTLISCNSTSLTSDFGYVYAKIDHGAASQDPTLEITTRNSLVGSSDQTPYRTYRLLWRKYDEAGKVKIIDFRTTPTIPAFGW